MSSSNIDSQYASVGDQSGLFAGDGGYDISHDDKTDKTSPLLIPAVSGNQSGSASGTTGSAIADGTLTIRDTANQQQDVATLSHDTDDANGHIDKIFDKDKVEQDLAFTQAVGRVSMEVVQDALQYQLTSARDKAREQLENTPAFVNASAADQEAMLEASPIYKAAQDQYGIGSPYAMAGQAISGALAGLAGGSLSQVAAGGLAPYLALAVKTATTDPDTKQVNVVANALGHALAGGLVAYLQGGSVAAGAAGAAGGELAAEAIMAELYPGKSADELTEEQKQTVSTLSSLAAGLAGAVASNSSTTVGEAAQAGKNAVENNDLGSVGSLEDVFGSQGAKYFVGAGSLAEQMLENGATPEEMSAALAKYVQGNTPEGQDPAKAFLTAWAEFYGMPVNSIMGGNLTLESAAEIVASGVPTSEAKLMEYVAAKSFLAVVKESGVGSTANAGINGGSLSGTVTKIPPNAASEQIRSLTRENESAVILSENGYHIEQNPVTSGLKNPDYIIDGEIFDNYAPKSSSVRNIWSEVKVKIDEGQTSNVVVNLADSSVSLDTLKSQFSHWPINGLDKIIVIEKSGTVVKLK